MVLAVQGVDGLLAFFGAAHGDETEAAGTAAGAIHHQIGFNHSAVGGKLVLKIVFGHVEREISNE